MASNTDSNRNAAAIRESRRRRILEGGSDRLALITGLTQSLAPESSSSYDNKPNSPVSSQPLASPDKIAGSSGEDGRLGSVLPNDDPTTAVGRTPNVIGPPLDEHKASIETTSRASNLNEGSTKQSPLVSSIDQSSAVSASATVQNLELQPSPRRFLTPSQISTAIASSERPRLFCSVTIALFVVLSSLGFPMLGSNIIKSVISFRPLYLVLLTNLTLVLARLLINNQRGSERTVGRDINIPPTNQDWVQQAGKALEVGLVMQKAVDAVLMDCSVYALIIIAGFSFVK